MKVDSPWNTSLIGTPSWRAFSRSSITEVCGVVGLNDVNRFASSGRWRASARNAWACRPRSSTVSVPLRSCNRKLKPPAAPNPEIVGGMKGNATAVGSSARAAPTVR